MKQIFSLLLVFVFVQNQCLALWGGPFDNNQVPGASADGTYSAVLSGKNLIGLVQFGVSESTETAGRFVVFVEGVLTSGDATGIADVSSKTVAGALDGGGDADGMFTAQMHGYPQQVILEGKGTLSSAEANVETTTTFPEIPDAGTGITVTTSDQVTRGVTEFRVRGSRTSRNAFTSTGTGAGPIPIPLP